MATVPISFDYTGVIVSPQDAALQPRVTGAIIERPFEPGGTVKKDQVLFRIDPRPFEVALKRRQGPERAGQGRAGVRRSGGATNRHAGRQGLRHPAAPAAAREQPDLGQEPGSGGRGRDCPRAARPRLRRDQGALRWPCQPLGINIGDLVTANATNLVSVVQIDPIDVQVALSTDDSKAVRAAMQGGGAALTVLGDDDEPGREAKVYKLDNRFDPATARRLIRAKLANADGLYLPASSSDASAGRPQGAPPGADPRPVGATRPAHRLEHRRRLPHQHAARRDGWKLRRSDRDRERIEARYPDRVRSSATPQPNLCVGVRPAAKADIAQDGTRGMPQSGSSAGGAGSAAP